ncbi:acyl-CoA thioesterase [Sphaerotilus mobilis]|uniref:Acyl-CoA thioester hydrolase n=1 Tax=Sphaerotilus mobilis TaxID=47994 RepID=A0A4Q7LSN7_9BURK|nr:acyl-CoA thioesterase [Sphaerotilus mobilis]RZS57826.1 acyl-CoA thioester hydrolase [Sphaerotilus mobilis]
MRFDLPEDKVLVHTSQFPVRWGDMDAMGHVNNSVYFRYLEIARLDWLASTGLQVEPHGIGPVIVNAFCNFHLQLAFPAEVLARMYVRRPGRSSIETYTTMERLDEPGVVYASGGALIVWVDQRLRKSVPLPDALRALAVPG